MPRIDPLQLLKCLGVLLTPSGGIRSNEEVQRLASLMMKFSKKLVSKCVYILILKNTEPQLLGLFMSAGGWTLVLTWLSDGISGKNWALVTELLELLLMCPVDVERLKSNSIPRLVKGLSKDETLGQVNILASRLVEQWLKIVKDETVSPEVTSTVVIVNQDSIVVEEIPQENVSHEIVEEITLKSERAIEDELSASSQVVVTPQQFYKLTVRDGKQVIAKVDSVSDSAIERTEQSSDSMTLSEDNVPVNHVDVHTEVSEEKEKKDSDKKITNKEKDRSKHDRSKHRSSSSSKSSSSKSSSNKDKSSSNSSSSSSRDKNKDKDRDRTKDRDKHKHRSNGSVKHSSNNSSSSSSSSSNHNHNNNNTKDNKEKQAERDKDTLTKIQPKSVEKLGRIPKKSSTSDSKKGDKKSSDSASEHRTKPSISIEVRKKDGGDRPKTVKVFNSKLRSTGLEEAPKPPPPRTSSKKTTTATLPALPVKRPSPSREAPPPPEKRMKLPETEIENKPGGIKLIPPKPKRKYSILSDSNLKLRCCFRNILDHLQWTTSALADQIPIYVV